jgi:hypothetical protein
MSQQPNTRGWIGKYALGGKDAPAARVEPSAPELLNLPSSSSNSNNNNNNNSNNFSNIRAEQYMNPFNSNTSRNGNAAVADVVTPLLEPDVDNNIVHDINFNLWNSVIPQIITYHKMNSESSNVDVWDKAEKQFKERQKMGSFHIVTPADKKKYGELHELIKNYILQDNLPLAVTRYYANSEKKKAVKRMHDLEFIQFFNPDLLSSNHLGGHVVDSDIISSDDANLFHKSGITPHTALSKQGIQTRFQIKISPSFNDISRAQRKSRTHPYQVVGGENNPVSSFMSNIDIFEFAKPWVHARMGDKGKHMECRLVWGVPGTLLETTTVSDLLLSSKYAAENGQKFFVILLGVAAFPVVESDGKKKLDKMHKGMELHFFTAEDVSRIMQGASFDYDEDNSFDSLMEYQAFDQYDDDFGPKHNAKRDLLSLMANSEVSSGSDEERRALFDLYNDPKISRVTGIDSTQRPFYLDKKAKVYEASLVCFARSLCKLFQFELEQPVRGAVLFTFQVFLQNNHYLRSTSEKGPFDFYESKKTDRFSDFLKLNKFSSNSSADSQMKVPVKIIKLSEKKKDF